MFVISFNIYLFIYFTVEYAIPSNDCDVFLSVVDSYSYSFLNSLCTFCQVLKKELSCLGKGKAQPAMITFLIPFSVSVQSL